MISKERRILFYRGNSAEQLFGLERTQIGGGAFVGEADVCSRIDEPAAWRQLEQARKGNRTVGIASHGGLTDVQADEIGGADVDDVPGVVGGVRILEHVRASTVVGDIVAEFVFFPGVQ